MSRKFRNKYRIESTRLQDWDYKWNGAYFVTICCKNQENHFGKIVDGKMELSGIGKLADKFWYEITSHAENVELGAFVVMPNHVHGIVILFGDDNPDNGNESANKSPNDGIDRDVSTVETRHALSLPMPVPIPMPVHQKRHKPDKTTGPKFDERVGNTSPNDDIDRDDNTVETRHVLSLPMPVPIPMLVPMQIPMKPKHYKSDKTIGQQRWQKPGKNTLSSIIGGYKSAVTKHARRSGYTFAWQDLFHEHIIRNQTSFVNISEYIINNPARWEHDRFYRL